MADVAPEDGGSAVKKDDGGLPVGPQPGVSYPISVHYCKECSLPVEYCDYGPHPEKCRKWLETNLPELVETLATSDTPEAGEGDEKKHQKRGGKGSKPAATKKAPTKAPANVTLQRAPRGKNKSVTVIKGLGAFDIDLKVAAKFFASRFACGSSVTGADEIVIQGDVKDDLFDVIPEKWPVVDEDAIEDLGDQKR
uniref:Density-regulated protein n=1 Tax=Plectus sambesii TaxID=2011161 RepID=A0A914XPJ4_9BILA